MKFKNIINILIPNVLIYFCKIFKYCSSRGFGNLDKTTCINYPLITSGKKNIFLGKKTSIGYGSLIYATNAKFVMGQYSYTGPFLKVFCGNHERRVGRFSRSIDEKEKNHDLGLDKDVIVCEDVWIGSNVTLLAGSTIARGATIASGAVVSGDIPPYSISGGIPAKIIKFYWSIDEILAHEEKLYEVTERFTREQLESIFDKFNKYG